LGDPFNPMSGGRWSENMHRDLGDLTELRELIRTQG